jgi:hypothetical protein
MPHQKLDGTRVICPVFQIKDHFILAFISFERLENTNNQS